MEDKGLKGNAGKTKLMICGTGLDLLQSSCEFPCAIYHTVVYLLQWLQTLGAYEIKTAAAWVTCFPLADTVNWSSVLI